jgi:hypothetical protein
MRSKLAASIALAVIKLVIMPLAVYGLCFSLGLNPLYTIAAVVCAAVATAKTVFILAGEYRVGWSRSGSRSQRSVGRHAAGLALRAFGPLATGGLVQFVPLHRLRIDLVLLDNSLGERRLRNP